MEDPTMGDSQNPGQDQPREEPSAANDLSSTAMNVGSQLTQGERMIAIGSLVILAICWLVGTLILDEYGLSNSTLLIPIGLLAAMYFYYSGAQGAWLSLYGTILKVGAWAIAIIGIYSIIDDSIITSNRFSGATLFFELSFYVAAVFCGIGAWQLRGDDR
jgi:hypothetical protein